MIDIFAQKPRTPEEMKSVLERISKIWTQFPHLRFGQLIGNCFSSELKLYHAEDEDLLSKMQSMYEEDDNP